MIQKRRQVVPRIADGAVDCLRVTDYLRAMERCRPTTLKRAVLRGGRYGTQWCALAPSETGGTWTGADLRAPISSADTLPNSLNATMQFSALHFRFSAAPRPYAQVKSIRLYQGSTTIGRG